MDKSEITGPFFVDKKQPGIVRGGFYDEMGGMMVGMRAQWVCAALNAALADQNLLPGATKKSRK